MSWTYARSGVDIKKVRKAHMNIGELVKETFKLRFGKFGEVLSKFGHYASLIAIGGGKALALHADGVGTKVLIAQLADKYDTIGIDAVAMCVNDLICVGAEPVALIDYLAVQRLDDELINDVMKGLVKGAEIANIAVIGGETAVMPDVIKGAVEGKGFDLAGLSIGVVDLNRVITGESMKVGDVVIGLESSGVHSNGLTLARKILFELGGYGIDDQPSGLKRKLGEELLTPTKIYVNEILEILSKTEVHAIAHITGGAYTKLKRFQNYAKVGFKLDRMPEPQQIFKLIQKLGKITDKEMYQTFNMGIGICVVAPKEHERDIISICLKHNTRAQSIGEIVDGTAITIKVPGGGTVKMD